MAKSYFLDFAFFKNLRKKKGKVKKQGRPVTEKGSNCIQFSTILHVKTNKQTKQNKTVEKKLILRGARARNHGNARRSNSPVILTVRFCPQTLQLM